MTGADRLTLEDVNAEIQAVRRQRRKFAPAENWLPRNRCPFDCPTRTMSRSWTPACGGTEGVHSVRVGKRTTDARPQPRGRFILVDPPRRDRKTLNSARAPGDWPGRRGRRRYRRVPGLRVLLKSPRRPKRVRTAGTDCTCTDRVNSKSNVVLVGPMGSGKTAVGRQLARHLDMEFVDSDTEIVRRTGVDIAFIFDKEGERGFRARECAVIADLAARENVVLATGGGAVVDPGNRSLLRGSGTVVYLRTSLAHQLERTRHSKNRPLLQNMDRAAVLQRLMEVRGPLYDEVADIVVTTGNQKIEAMVREIGDRLREHGFAATRSAGAAEAQAPADGR